MRNLHLVFSALNFLFLVLLTAVGGVGIAFFLTPVWQYRFADWLMYSHYELLVVSGVILALSLGLLVLCGYAYRRSFYQVQLGTSQHRAEVNLEVVRILACRYWQNHFPTVNHQVDVLLHADKTLEFFAELPSDVIEEQEIALKKIESELGRQLARHLGYCQPFLLTITQLH